MMLLGLGSNVQLVFSPVYEAKDSSLVGEEIYSLHFCSCLFGYGTHFSRLVLKKYLKSNIFELYNNGLQICLLAPALPSNMCLALTQQTEV